MKLRPVGLALALCTLAVVTARAQDPPVYKAGPGVTNPTIVREEKPRYTQAAMQAKVQGIVEVEAVILKDGTVGEVRIHKSLDKVFGLDEEALRAARAWRFKPAMKDGEPVLFQVIIQLEYRLHGGPNQPVDEFMRDALPANMPYVEMPKLKSVPPPFFPADAMKAGLQGRVDVEVVVAADGTVARARVKRSLDKKYGLDEQAIFAASRAIFEPGTAQGKPIPVATTITLEFRIK